MYTTPGNSLISACLLKWPVMFPLAMVGLGGVFYSGLCDPPIAATGIVPVVTQVVEPPVVVTMPLTPPVTPTVVAPPVVKETPKVAPPKPVQPPVQKKKKIKE